MKLHNTAPLGAVVPGVWPALVDAMLDYVTGRHRGHEYIVSLPLGAAAFVPRHHTRLWRVEDDQLVSYRRHVYREHEIATFDGLANWQVFLGPTWDLRRPPPAEQRPPSYLGDITTGLFAICQLAAPAS